jgi:hypothetical protein
MNPCEPPSSTAAFSITNGAAGTATLCQFKAASLCALTVSDGIYVLVVELSRVCGRCSSLCDEFGPQSAFRCRVIEAAPEFDLMGFRVGEVLKAKNAVF